MTRSHRRATTTNAPRAPANCQSSVVKSHSSQQNMYQCRPPEVVRTPSRAIIILLLLAGLSAVKELTGSPYDACPARRKVRRGAGPLQGHYNVRRDGW